MQVFHVEKDHSGLNKCSSPEDPLYTELTEQLRRLQPNAPVKVNKTQQGVIDRLRPVIASDAEYHPSFDEHGRSRMECLPQTRVQLLNDICEWLDDFDSSQKHLYWLQGKAGTGKSTIACTIVSRMAKRKRIVANFFFKRGEGDRARLKRFFTTLSAQLVRKLPGFATAVKDALESEPSLPEQDPRIQFKKLIQEPLQKHNLGPHKAIVVVVDALDECDSKEDLANLVQQLLQPIVCIESAKSSSGQLLVKYFLTSRLDHHTQSDFNKVPENISEKAELEKATEDTTKRDIERYLKDKLGDINGFLDPLSNSDPWSNPADVEILKKLADRASPLFEFAAAACRYIEQPTVPGGPKVLIQDILDTNNYGDLDGVYLPILRRRFLKLKGTLYDRARTAFEDVIGSLVCLADSVTVPFLAKLLGQNELVVHHELLLFQSVLVVPKRQDSSLPISLFHESFRDFLIGSEANEEFKLDVQNIHARLATRCLEFLRGALRENICNLKSPGTYRSDVDEETIRTSISEEAQYACRFWIYHLRQGGFHLRDDDDWHSFLSFHFLHWVEALALLGRFSEVAPLMRQLETIIHPTEGAKLRAFLKDANRFIPYFGQIIDTAPLQIYSSALTFSPSESVIRKTFDACRSKWITRTPTVKTQWSPCVQTLEGHRQEVLSVTYSNRGILASGDRGGVVRIWDPQSGVCLQSSRILEDGGNGIMRRSYGISAMAFSTADKLACLTGKSIATWDESQHDCFRKLDYMLGLDSRTKGAVAFTDKQELLFTDAMRGRVLKSDLEHDPGIILSDSYARRIVLSFDGQWIAYLRPKRTTIFHMDTNDKHWPSALERWYMPEFGVESYDLSMGGCFSRDNRYFARYANGACVQIWDVAERKHLGVLEDTTTTSTVAFSPDGRLIATGNRYDGSITLWDWKAVEGATRLTILKGHRASINSLAFSPDGARLSSASTDRSVKIWDVSSESLKLFGEESDGIRHGDHISVAMDGQRFVTGPFGLRSKTYHLWDNYGEKCIALPLEHNIYAVISANGNVFAAFSFTDVKLWDVESGSHRPEIDGHCHISGSMILSAALSANGDRLVTGSLDGRVGLWETRTGRLLRESQRKRDKCPAVAISSDGEQVASSADFDIWVEDASGERFSGRDESSWQFVESLTFSPNGDRLASVTDKSVTTIWDLTTGARLRTFECDGLRLKPDFSWMLDRSFIDFDFAIATDLPENLPWHECLTKHYINNEGDWVMKHSQKLLWLPPEYRPKAAAAARSNIVIVRALGRPYLIGLSDDGLALDGTGA
ncbi:hypothetical protein M440DRAFT_1099538 [Trichoderma longibrachiatum ATCC 18648]|uniref:Mitochondrial division protein 1 n=1 Tax=Trichoderma longibrachiatum ATCC 18648 TaxID=983965 RepID=A0A2T4BS88_TRILO|nr:hypothetical protein M440DRAFT_1099538 [Trichoderma longibrachiatum ATCC 18648]